MSEARKVLQRRRRHRRVRRKVFGTTERLRLSVFRSNTHIYAQLIDDAQHRTLVSASSRELNGRSPVKKGDSGGKIGAARQTGKLLAERAAALNIRSAVFDRGGYLFHGRVRGLAEGAREGGLEF